MEYKILDYAPEKWTPLKCALLLKYMAWMLTGRSTDLKITNTLARFGAAVVHDLFPEYPENMDAVIPAGTPWRFDPVKVEKPDSGFLPRAVRAGLQFEPHSVNGSNNWVVAGERTTTGRPKPRRWYRHSKRHSPTSNPKGASASTPITITIRRTHDHYRPH